MKNKRQSEGHSETENPRKRDKNMASMPGSQSSFQRGLSGWIAAAVLLGAFLLFQVQPVISKTILPWFGGSPAVWTTCLLFFQLLLLAGYAFADWLTRWPQPRQQALIHLSLIGLALLTLPITPGEFWKPADGSYPAGRILLLLTAKIGLPYFLLASTSPLMQVWFARVYPDRSPYRLYALSNAGSLGALLTYPFLVEPALTTRTQGIVWSALFVLFAACCGWLTIRLWRAGLLPTLPTTDSAATQPDGGDKPTWRQRAAWLWWPALSCVLLMAVTNHLCQDLAVVPLLWIAPLSVYLLSFIICFDREAWYHRRGFALAAALAVLVLSYLPLAGYFERFYAQMGLSLRMAHFAKHVAVEAMVFLVALFLLCMVCHGELVRRRPKAGHLTSFYLSVAAGGALGGAFVAVICPLVFASYVELNAALLLGFLVALALLVREVRTHRALSSPVLRFSAILAGWLATAVVTWGQFERWDAERGIARARNFYGVLSVRERFADDPEHHGRILFHGNTVHGYQLLAEDDRDTPTSYYSTNSGAGLALQHFRPEAPIRVGAVGLGAGTIAAYGRPGDLYRFYEINPLVVDMAYRYFTFLDDSEATIEIVLGDARLSLERQPPQQYDVLVLDAFSGDTIPVHLLTREAMEIYLRQIAADGVIAIHISNRHVNLIPVVLELAWHFDLPSVLIRQSQVDRFRANPSDWMLLTRNEQFLDSEAIRSAASHPDRWPDFPLWTDQYNNLLHILHPPMIRVAPSAD
jgi:spermidine synthase